jgi:hypothetical protein
MGNLHIPYKVGDRIARAQSMILYYIVLLLLLEVVGIKNSILRTWKHNQVVIFFPWGLSKVQTRVKILKITLEVQQKLYYFNIF